MRMNALLAFLFVFLGVPIVIASDAETPLPVPPSLMEQTTHQLLGLNQAPDAIAAENTLTALPQPQAIAYWSGAAYMGTNCGGAQFAWLSYPLDVCLPNPDKTTEWLKYTAGTNAITLTKYSDAGCFTVQSTTSLGTACENTASTSTPTSIMRSLSATRWGYSIQSGFTRIVLNTYQNTECDGTPSEISTKTVDECISGDDKYQCVSVGGTMYALETGYYDRSGSCSSSAETMAVFMPASPDGKCFRSNSNPQSVSVACVSAASFGALPLHALSIMLIALVLAIVHHFV